MQIFGYFQGNINKDYTGMEINSSQHTYDTTINPEHEMLINLASPETQFLKNLQSPRLNLSSLLSKRCPTSATSTSDIPAAYFLNDQSSDPNTRIPQFTCYYQQSAMIKDCHSLLKKLKTVQTQTSPTSKTTKAAQLKPRAQQQDPQRQINFDFDSLKLKNLTISVRDPLLSNEDENHGEQQNRHLSDIELLRQVYDELRNKISQV